MSSAFKILKKGVKFDHGNDFELFKNYAKSILSWLNGRIVELLNSSIFVKLFNLLTTKLKNLFTTHNSLFTKKVFAFTLAETLVVVGIIGVVAALTLPNLNQSTGNKEKVVKLKKIYSSLSDALGQAELVYGPYQRWFVNDSCTATYGGASANKPCMKRTGERLIEFLKISKNCEFGQGCFPNSVAKYKDGSSDTNNDTATYYKFILSDNTSVGISFVTKQGIYLEGLGATYYTQIKVDIDGAGKGANTRGIDLFAFYITDKGILPEGHLRTHNDLYNNCFVKGVGCLGWIMESDNMDYLKADPNGKCPNNTILSETVTSCN